MGFPGRKNIEKARTIECIEQAYERKNARDYHDRVLNYYIQALVMYQRVLPMNDDNITECLERIGHFYDVIGKFDLGLDTCTRTASSTLYSSCENFNKFIIDLNQLIENFKKRRVAKFVTEKTLTPACLLLNEMMTLRIHALGEDVNLRPLPL